MKRLFTLLALVLGFVSLTSAQVQPSTVQPSEGRPDHLYTMVSGGGYYVNALTAPTQTEENYGLFAFYAVPGKTNTYYIYSYKASKWVSFTPAASYSNKKDFVQMTPNKVEGAYFIVKNYSGTNFEIQPVTTGGSGDKYLNWYQGIGANPVDGTNTLGLWQDSGAKDAGSRWTLNEVVIETRTYTMHFPEGLTVTINGQNYQNGDTYTIEGKLTKDDLQFVVSDGKFAAVSIDDVNQTVTITIVDLPSQTDKAAYTNAVLYPQQQTAVGEAYLTKTDNLYALGNNVLEAGFMKVGNALYFAGCKAMNLEAGTEPFTVGFGAGETVPASAMTLQSVEMQDLTGSATAVGGAEHFNGKALVANYTYNYKGAEIQIVWRAVLRDGSHYLRTEMELKGENVDMYDVIPMIYNVDTQAAGSTPAVVGNTRGAVLMSNKIFAGLEHPTAYNTVGEASGEDDKWTLDHALTAQSLTATSWQQVAEADIPNRVREATGAGYPNVYAYTMQNVALKANQRVEVTVAYTSGNHRLNFGGCDLLASNGDIAASDYHSGYSGNAHSNNTFAFIAPNDGTYSIRVFAQNQTETIDASSNLTGNVYNAKPGAVINSDVVGIQGRWSRNTTLESGETWKISGVVGLVAQDGQQANENIHKTQKRRSFLAYSERERAVPWRANPAYISWYELNIDRNNAANPVNNMNADQVMDVMNHWRSDLYDRYGVAPQSFVIDDGWDNYGTWTFHDGFPNEMRDMAAAAEAMGGGVGAWLGPVGGYGTSGNYRRNYWSSRGGMQLSNPAYYQVFKDAAYNLTQNQGDFRFFKFDGISAQFSAVGPDAGDTGNENAEGIIRLERYVREELKRDIFFNTTVGTWASPFWYHYTDATWRQEGDYGTAGNNSIDRENWITYRDRLVYQNYVTNSPICPINTLMTHGFIFSTHGQVSKNLTYEPALRELRCAFACGSGMVELYNDYSLMNVTNNGQLWADLAECIAWQKRNADVLPDAHWVGGNPWNGSSAAVYGWAAWNGTKSVLTLRNGANSAQSYSFTLREALNIPANVNGSIILRKSWGVQDALQGLTEGEAINIDQTLNVSLPGSSVFSFDGIDDAATKTAVTAITLTPENGQANVEVGKTLVIRATTNEGATFPAITWSSSDTTIGTVNAGLVVGKRQGKVTITAAATDGSGVVATIEVTVGESTEPEPVVEDYAINFPRTQVRTRTDRSLNSISLTAEGQAEQTLTVNERYSYNDLTGDESNVLSVPAGATLTTDFNYSGIWMHGYVYIDLENDKQFSFAEGNTNQTGTDLQTFSFYSGNFSDDSAGYNSLGSYITGNSRSVLNPPTFTAPTTTGDYRIRFKVDWNSVDAGGQKALDGTCTGQNGILANGGYIVDAILSVVGTGTGILNNELQGTSRLYDLSGRRLHNAPQHGVFIQNGRKVVK